jgi:tRNA threonylcarbamoyladenosine biosynthesis protein TsaE
MDRHTTEPKLDRSLPVCVYPLETLEATRGLAQRLARRLQGPITLAIDGTLGAGKTQLVRYLVSALGGVEEAVTSPTYVLMQTYAARCKIHHFDFYRLNSPAQVWDLGIDELYEQDCVVVIEWADKFPECLPADVVTISLNQLDAQRRLATLSSNGPRSAAVVRSLMAD